MAEQTWIKAFFCLYIIVNVKAFNNSQRKPPTFSDVYSASGVLRLPYAELVEPFDVYYDAVNGRSRTDYYHGLTKTVQYAADDSSQFGYSLNVIFVTTEQVRNRKACIFTNGTEYDQITTQGILPDISNFEYVGVEVWQGVECDKWCNVTVIGDKENKYTMWISKKDNAPIHYEMMGFDTLLDSHYDKYELDYHSYNTSGALDAELFDIGKDLDCSNSSDVGPQHVHLHTPIKEFVENHDDHVHVAFETFKTLHGVKYGNSAEHETRKNIFRQNHRYVHSFNRAGRGYRLATNRFSDRTDNEVLRYRTGVKPIMAGNSNHGLPFHKHKHSSKHIPESFDWRLYGAVNPVKDQAVCGSCWSFAVTGTIEGALFLKTGRRVSLSEQALVDCSWGFDNNGCDGGNDFTSYEWIMKHGGIPTADSYGPYLGVDGLCHDENSTKVAAIGSYVNVTSGDIEALKMAVVTHGPVAVSFDASLKDFRFYSNGIYYNQECKNGTDDLDHALLVVGFGVLEDEHYWLVKNSWSTYWGNDGYFLISHKDNNCGIATAPTYVNLK